MTTFHHSAFKIETSSTKRVVNPFLHTRNANDVNMDVLFIHSRIKNSTKMHCKKNSSKYTIYNEKTKLKLIKLEIRPTM